jgi:phospholipid/cholesterol/gamma-HCH transport system substrate-binding protein
VLHRSTRNDIIVGLFVLIALGIFMYMTFLVQGTSGSNPVKLRVIYPEVAGLELGSPVLISGFRGGRVMSMEAVRAADGSQEVVVHTEVSRTIPIFKDAKMYLRQQGFIGDKRIEIDPGTEAAGPIDYEQPFRGVPYRDLTDMFAGSEEIVGNLNEVLANVRNFTADQERIARIDASLANVADSSRQISEILGDNRESVKQITTNVEEVTKRSIAIAEKTEAMIDEARRSVDELNVIIAQLQKDRASAMGNVDRVLAQAESAGEKANTLLATTEGEVKVISADIQVAAKELAEVLAKVNRGDGTAGRLVNDPGPFEELQASITAFRSLLIEEARQNADHDPSLEYRVLETSPAPPAGY